jgi:predicted ester cyclase
MTSPAEQNKATIRRLYERALEDPKVIDEVYAVDVELHMPGLPEDPFGPAPIHQLFSMIQDAFPGIQVSIEDLVAEGDKVVARVTLHRPHDGSIAGVSPQAPQAAWTRIEVFRLHRGRIVEQWGDRDDIALLQQIGVGAPPLDPRGRVRVTGG